MKKSRPFLFYPFLVIVIGGFLLLEKFLGGPLFNSVTTLTGPVDFSLKQVIGYWQRLSHGGELQQEVSQLREENQRLSVRLAETEEVARENELLRTRLGLNEPVARRLLLAGVRGSRGDYSLGAVVVDRGTVDSVTHGLAVVNEHNVLIGIVGETGAHSATVILTGNPRLSLNLKIAGRGILTRSRVVGGHVTLEAVTTQEEIFPGDVAITVGSDSLPAGLPVFRVAEVRPARGGLFQKIIAEPLAEPLALEKVFVLLE